MDYIMCPWLLEDRNSYAFSPPSSLTCFFTQYQTADEPNFTVVYGLDGLSSVSRAFPKEVKSSSPGATWLGSSWDSLLEVILLLLLFASLLGPSEHQRREQTFIPELSTFSRWAECSHTHRRGARGQSRKQGRKWRSEQPARLRPELGLFYNFF